MKTNSAILIKNYKGKVNREAVFSRERKISQRKDF